MPYKKICLSAFIFVINFPAHSEGYSTVEKCATIFSSKKRLNCYDGLAKQGSNTSKSIKVPPQDITFRGRLEIINKMYNMNISPGAFAELPKEEQINMSNEAYALYLKTLQYENQEIR
jgi:hypothetical protein